VTAEVQPWQRPPFQPGHTLSVRHGAHSPRIVAPLARELYEEYAAAYPDLAAYPAALAALAKADAHALKIEEYLEEHGLADGDGNLRNDAIRHLRGFRLDQHRARESLGLTPASEAKLLSVRAEATKGAFDVEGARERATAARAARAARQAQP
jgi:hypothetical protein